MKGSDLVPRRKPPAAAMRPRWDREEEWGRRDPHRRLPHALWTSSRALKRQQWREKEEKRAWQPGMWVSTQAALVGDVGDETFL